MLLHFTSTNVIWSTCPNSAPPWSKQKRFGLIVNKYRLPCTAGIKMPYSRFPAAAGGSDHRRCPMKDMFLIIRVFTPCPADSGAGCQSASSIASPGGYNVMSGAAPPFGISITEKTTSKRTSSRSGTPPKPFRYSHDSQIAAKSGAVEGVALRTAAENISGRNRSAIFVFVVTGASGAGHAVNSCSYRHSCPPFPHRQLLNVCHSSSDSCLVPALRFPPTSAIIQGCIRPESLRTARSVRYLAVWASSSRSTTISSSSVHRQVP